MRSRLRSCGRSFLAAVIATGSLAALAVGGASPAAADPITSVRGEACANITNVGLFGGPQAKLGCAPQAGNSFAPASTTTLAPSVALPSGGSASAITETDTDGSQAKYGPATINGGIWPPDVSSPTPSGPEIVSTQGTPEGGTVTSSADITLKAQPWPEYPCYTGYSPPPGHTGCPDPGGFGPAPVWGDSLHAECTATESSVTGSATFSNAFVAKATIVGGEDDGAPDPAATEAVPNNPSVNYTRHGVINNVGDVFTVVYNQHIYNADGSLTVNAVHMYLFGPVAVGEVIRGQATCGTTPGPTAPADTLAPSCGTPVVAAMGPQDPTPKSPRQELIGTADSGGIQSVTNVNVTNGTPQVGMNPSSSNTYLHFVPGQTGPLTILATRTAEAESAHLPMHWSFDVTDVAGNTSHCLGFEGPPVANDDAFNADANGTSTFLAPGVLANDTDGNEDPLTAGSASDPAHGSVTLNANGSFTYTADAGYNGPDTFTYVADDGRGPTDSATVTLTVGVPAPTELRVSDGVPPPGPYGNDPAEGGDGQTSAHAFTVTRTGSTAAVSTVKYRTNGGTATAGTDYTAVPLQTLTFAVGETSKTVTVDVLGDGLSEKNETFNLVLSSPTKAFLTDNIGVGTILNDDGSLPSFVVDAAYANTPPSVDEGDEGPTPATFTIFRNGNTNGTSTVKVKTTGGTATAGTDYTAVPLTTLTFGPGEYSQTVDVAVTGDLTPENNETFNLVLSSPVGAVIGDAAGTATIVDNEGPVTPAPATFIYVEDFGGGGGSESMGGMFFVNRTGDTNGTTTVKYKVGGGTATAGTDYAASEWGQFPALTGTFTFNPGEDFIFFDLASVDDNLVEPNKTFNLTLSSPTGGVIADGTGLWTIQDDDGSTSLSVDDPYVLEGNSGQTPATFTITRSGNTNGETKVKYVTKTAPSAEADDFTASPLNEVIFAPGETTKQVTVNITGDTAPETDERLSLALSATGATFQDATGTALIRNDD
ncbi:MAG TPA: Calx-beta domain-containing protein [Acidimicrobiales bacterium]